MQVAAGCCGNLPAGDGVTGVCLKHLTAGIAGRPDPEKIVPSPLYQAAAFGLRLNPSITIYNSGPMETKTAVSRK